MYTARRTALTAGILYLITHVTSVVTRLFLYNVPLADPDYLVTGGRHDAIALGSVLEVMLALAVVGTSVALYPIVRRASEGFAIGYVALRVVEGGVILVGVVAMVAYNAIEAEIAAGADPTVLLPIGHSLVSLYDWSFVVGPGLVCGVNTVVLAWVLFRSSLVPRFIPVLGLIGGPLVLAVNLTKIFGTFDSLPGFVGVSVLPIFAWEICLAVYLIARGPKSSRLLPAE